MAHTYVQDGGPPAAMFGYVGEWPSNANSFNHFPENMSQQPLLDQNDSAYIAGFFQDPDHASIEENFNWFDMENDTKFQGGGLGNHIHGLDDGSQTVSNPSVTLSGPRTAGYQTHANLPQSLPLTSPTHDFSLSRNFSNHDTNHASEDEIAAQQLYGMFSVGQSHHSHSEGLHSAVQAGSWGSIGTGQQTVNAQDSVHSPMDSSGRQSSYSNRSQMNNLSMGQYQLQNPLLQQQQQTQRWQQALQAQQMQSTRRIHHPSLQLDTAQQYNFFPPAQPQIRQAYSTNPPSQHFQGPSAMHFGSDSNFGDGSYQPPTDYTPHDQEKGANLNNVPFAAQVTVHGRSHAQTFTPEMHQRSIQRHSLPNSAINYSNPFSSPGTLGGLPLTSPLPANHRHSHPFNPMARPSIEDIEQDNDDVDFEESPPRKRRKSQMQRDDDSEYYPYGHVKAPVPKRGPKGHQATDASGDDYDIYGIPSSNTKASIKRRKSTTRARASPESEEWTSPSAMAGESPETAQSGKKGRGSQARLNLTEEEKRMNHIKSEKTRRDLIKIQYDTLDELVPALKGGKSGLSRADILQEIVNHVENTVAGNKTIMERLGLSGISRRDTALSTTLHG